MNYASSKMMDISPKFSTLVELVRFRARDSTAQTAFTFLVDGEHETVSLTYPELDRKARAIAAQLQQSCTVGDRALILFPPGLDYIAAFFGCLYAGVVAVPAYPPRNARNLPRIMAIANDAQASAILTPEVTRSKTQSLWSQTDGSQDIHWLSTDVAFPALAKDWQDLDLPSDTLALLQYTSGSTSLPKGVMLTHAHLLHHLSLISASFQTHPQSQGVIWLPPYHDMGLIGGILQPIYVGAAMTLMSPVAFLQRPLRWLQAISQWKATISGAPNFAYELCLRRTAPEQRLTLDLSSWEIAFNGAEPIRAETLNRFAEAFAPSGFRREAFYPCYGLAEATLMVTGCDKTKRPIIKRFQKTALAQHRAIVAHQESASVSDAESQTLVSCGHTLSNQEVVIVKPDTLTPCQPEQIGEIWVAGKSVVQGYWNQPEQTNLTFQARLKDREDIPFLRTGDLGFLQNGELFVTGRLKDLIIIRGRNYAPQDIEWAVGQSHASLQAGCSAAFALDTGREERLVVVQELDRHDRSSMLLDELIAAIRRVVAEQYDLEVYGVVLVKLGSIPKTSSGKIQHFACREAFLNQQLCVIHQSIQGGVMEGRSPDFNEPPTSSTPTSVGKSSREIQEWLIAQVAQTLGVSASTIEIHQPLAHYGLGSLAAVSLAGELEDWLDRRLSPLLIYDYPTIEALSQMLAIEPVVIRQQPASNENESQRQFEDLYKHCTRPLNPRHFPQVGEPAHGSGFPILGDFENQNPPELGGWGANAGMNATFQTTSQSGAELVDDIAIIGIGCRFPGAESPEAFWQLLQSGGDAIREIPGDRVLSRPENSPSGKRAIDHGGFLNAIDGFDSQFFGIAPREADGIDPQHRLLLEVAWEALEYAGQPMEPLAGSETGVFIGISSQDYAQLQANTTEVNAYAATGNAHSIAANRLSYLLNLQGPSLAVDTACSSSLVAVHLACQSLRSGECDLALAGGVNLLLLPILAIALSQAGMLSPDGRCKTFDASADGYGRGEGCGVVVLKPLNRALDAGDSILAVIKGSAVNQDGLSNGLTAPNGLAQQRVVQKALQRANVKPDWISYVEAHGTGTALGDPIEVNALQGVLMQGRSPEQSCAIGSVKANIGHLEAAAGIAGLIKTVLALQHRQIPPHLHLGTVNPHISLKASPFFIPTHRTDWASEPRFAGVSSFGFGGTNAHIILTEAPDRNPQRVQEPSSQQLESYLLPLSARSPLALRALAQRYRTFLRSETSLKSSLLDICYTASVHRSHHRDRLAVMGHTHAEMAERLDAFLQESTHSVEESGDSMQALGESYCLGNLVEWTQLYPQGQCVSLPTYPWQRQRHWFSTGESLIPVEQSVNQGMKGLEPGSVKRLTRASLLALPEGDRLSKLESYFQQKVSRVLSGGSSNLSIHEPLQNVGLDSLMVLDLKHRFETDLHLTLSMTEFLQDLSIAQLASRVLAQIAQPAPSLDIAWEEGVL